MKISVRRIGLKLVEVKFSDLHTTMESGTLDADEARELATVLRDAADELSPLPPPPRAEAGVQYKVSPTGWLMGLNSDGNWRPLFNMTIEQKEKVCEFEAAKENGRG